MTLNRELWERVGDFIKRNKIKTLQELTAKYNISNYPDYVDLLEIWKYTAKGEIITKKVAEKRQMRRLKGKLYGVKGGYLKKWEGKKTKVKKRGA